MKFSLAAAVLASTLTAGVAPAGAQVPPIPPGWQTERVVMLARHSVQAPVQSPEELAKFAASPWPSWPVAPGDLTPRGADLGHQMGQFYRILYGGRGLIEEAICPQPGTVVLWVDFDKRTEWAALSTLGGLYMRCLTPILKHQADLSKPDPLFHPQPSTSCPMDAASNRAAILARIGGDFSSVQREYAPQLSLLQSTLCPPGALGSSGAACGLAAEASAIVPDPAGGVAMKGPIAIGSMAAENFLMESAQGMPANEVAWGRLGNDKLRDVLKVRRLHLDLMEKTKPIARQRGSNMLAQIVAALQDGHKFPGGPNIAEPVRFGMLLGHDTNIVNIAGLLNLGWEVKGYQDNEAPPGSALAFELLREGRSGQRYVRMAFYAQTPEQLRNMTPLTIDNPPGMVAVELPACSAYAHDKACPLERFVEIANAAIDPACVSISNLTVKP